MELANRTVEVDDGKTLEVTLESLGDKLLVIVTEFFEPRFTLETTDGKKALDMYYHPFAYYQGQLH